MKVKIVSLFEIQTYNPFSFKGKGGLVLQNILFFCFVYTHDDTTEVRNHSLDSKEQPESHGFYYTLVFTLPSSHAPSCEY